MQKNQINKYLFDLCNFISLKFLHFFTIVLLLFLFLYEGMVYKNIEILYALFLILLIPIFLFYQIKEEPAKSDLLPYLTQKYKYSRHALSVQTYTFLSDSICLFFLQVGNLLFPYEVVWLQYMPFFLLFIRILLRYLVKFVIYVILHHKLMNNFI